MTLEQLRQKASSLPLAPGVYIMRDREDRVIYVGKAKKLRNRVSQYFQDTASHTAKTRQMVSKVDHFDVIIASSEFEALILECAQIKRHMPRYNILLKDDKGFPYLRLDMKAQYPKITLENQPKDDGAVYYGPYGSRGVTQKLLQTILEILHLPSCAKKFPQDLGKGRVCLNYHMGLCSGWCQMESPETQYRQTMEKARQLLLGNFTQVMAMLRTQMTQASDALNFELAASLRDQIEAISALGRKQHVTAGRDTETDAIGYGQTEVKACFSVLHFIGGELVDKQYEMFAVQEPAAAVASLVKQYYFDRGFCPRVILLPFEIEDRQLIEQLLTQQYEKKVSLIVPQRGDNVRLKELACSNAQQEAQRLTDREERTDAILALLGKTLSIDTPHRMESFDISNISGSDNVASMVVFQDGKPKKSQYRRFKVDLGGMQDDYTSMQQVLARRFTDYLNGEKGFTEKPDLLLIDGGSAHAQVAENVLLLLQLQIPVFGMVKDDRHRTRALITAKGEEIRIDNNQALFSLIGNIQEETHRFAITYHRQLRSKRLRYSELDSIPGIGQKRKQELLKRFSSLTAIRAASIEELDRVLPKNTAQAVYKHFHQEA